VAIADQTRCFNVCIKYYRSSRPLR